MSQPRDMEPDNAVRSRPIAAVSWVLLTIALVAAGAAAVVQFGGVVSDAALAAKIVRVVLLTGLLAVLAAWS